MVDVDNHVQANRLSSHAAEAEAMEVVVVPVEEMAVMVVVVMVPVEEMAVMVMVEEVLVVATMTVEEVLVVYFP